MGGISYAESRCSEVSKIAVVVVAGVGPSQNEADSRSVLATTLDEALSCAGSPTSDLEHPDTPETRPGKGSLGLSSDGFLSIVQCALQAPYA